MKPLIETGKLMTQLEHALSSVKNIMSDDKVMAWYEEDFAIRFSWSSNAMEGNTLSFEQTVALLEHDEVSEGHSYTEHQEAKNLYRAVRESMVPFCKQLISEEWIKRNNRTIRGQGGEYRTEDVKVGTIIETTYSPPKAELVPNLMESYLEQVNFEANGLTELIEKVVRSHLHFERIHPFFDGNGRIGRMILNQQLINHDLLPISINRNSEYRQSFKRYDKNGDISQMVHVVIHGELESIERLQELKKKEIRKQSSDHELSAAKKANES